MTRLENGVAKMQRNWATQEKVDFNDLGQRSQLAGTCEKLLHG